MSQALLPHPTDCLILIPFRPEMNRILPGPEVFSNLGARCFAGKNQGIVTLFGKLLAASLPLDADYWQNLASELQGRTGDVA